MNAKQIVNSSEVPHGSLYVYDSNFNIFRVLVSLRSRLRWLVGRLPQLGSAKC